MVRKARVACGGGVTLVRTTLDKVAAMNVV